MPSKPTSLWKTAYLIAAVTLLSKAAGLIRQQVIAAQYGVSPEVDAFNYAYTLPAFFLIILGGVNGPFHSAIVSVLAKDTKDRARVMETLNTLVALIFGAATVGLIVFAPAIVGLVAQGAPPEVRTLAIQEMRIMAPLAFIAGQVGLGFGALTAANQFVLPSLSPLLSSGAVVAAILIFSKENGAQVLAWGTVAGALLQWLAQIPLQWKLGLGSLRPRLDWQLPQVQQVMKLMAPATLSSTLSNLNVYIDLYFASMLPVGVAGGLAFANLLVQTPLGILSNAFLIPLLPMYSRLSGLEQRPQFIAAIRKGLVTAALCTFPLMAICLALSQPLVQIVYQRAAFDAEDVRLVSGLFVGGVVGMFSFLGRDLMVKILYALGDGRTPLITSVLGIGANFSLDFLFTRWLGGPGLPLATSFVSTMSFLILLTLLSRKIGSLADLQQILLPIGLLLVGAVITGGLVWLTYQQVNQLWPLGNLLVLLGKLGAAVAVGVLFQGGLIMFLRKQRVISL